MGDHRLQKVETKVSAATGGAVGGSSLALLALITDLPEWAQILVILAGPPIATFVSGYMANHTPRPNSQG